MMRITNILLPIDFSPPSMVALSCGIACARTFGAKLILLHVVEASSLLSYTFPSVAEKFERESSDQAYRLLEALIVPADRDGFELRYIVKSGDVHTEIEELAVAEHADLLVMGTHGRGLLPRLLIGSVTETILRKVSVPVLTVCRGVCPEEVTRMLFATDLSESSDEAFEVALGMAAAKGASIIVAHVLEERSASVQALAKVEAKFRDFIARGAKRNINVGTLLAEGNPSTALVRIAEEQQVAVMILAVRSGATLNRALLGSTAEPVIRAAGVPVLSVPVRAAGAARK